MPAADAAASIDTGAQFASVLSAPIPFLLAVGAVGALIWWLVGQINKGETRGLQSQIAALQERITLRDEQNAELLKKVSAPDKIVVMASNTAIAQGDRDIASRFGVPVFFRSAVPPVPNPEAMSARRGGDVLIKAGDGGESGPGGNVVIKAGDGRTG